MYSYNILNFQESTILNASTKKKKKKKAGNLLNAPLTDKSYIPFVIHLDDGPKLGRNYLGNNWLWKIYQLISAEYHKINTAIRKDLPKNMLTKNIYYVQSNMY